LFAKDGTKLFESAYREIYNNSRNYKSTETILEEDEHIIGFKSKADVNYATHQDFQFVIGKME
jgi:hypothetical protein